MTRFPRSAAKVRYFWLVLPDADLCLSDPGFGIDVTVSSDPKTLTAVWMGDPHANTPMLDVGGTRVVGGSYPARIWGAFMGAALTGQPAAAPSNSIAKRPPLQYCAVAVSGQAARASASAGSGCPELAMRARAISTRSSPSTWRVTRAWLQPPCTAC